MNDKAPNPTAETDNTENPTPGQQFLNYGFWPLCLILGLWQGSPALALFAGAIYRILLNTDTPFGYSKWGKYVLQFAIVLLGFRLHIQSLWATSSQYAGFMSVSVLLTLMFGLWLGKVLKVEHNISTMTAAGAAICGGSAIAAVASAIRSTAAQIAVSLSIVLVLNAIAIVLFPKIGLWLNFTQEQFGVWAALAIHDTSSVVGASEEFGTKANEIATTLKLGRALWILPLTYFFSVRYHNAETAAATEEAAELPAKSEVSKEQDGSETQQKTQAKAKVKVPVFIILFVLASLLGSGLSSYEFWGPVSKIVKILAKKSLVLSLLLIGTGLTRNALSNFRGKTLAQGLIIWIVTAATTCAIVKLWM